MDKEKKKQIQTLKQHLFNIEGVLQIIIDYRKSLVTVRIHSGYSLNAYELQEISETMKQINSLLNE